MSFTIISQEYRKARKPHRCIWCGESIAVGQSYFHERSIFHSEPQSHDFHSECFGALQLALQTEGGGEIEFTPWENERPQHAG